MIANLASVTVLLGAAFLLAPPARAEGKCNLETIKGGYGFLNKGLAFGINFAGVGAMTLDGTGNLSGHGFTSFGGAISNDTFTGSYTVNADCTGTLSVTFPTMFTVTSSMAISDNGKEVFLIFTVPGEVGTGTMKPLAFGKCGKQSLNGGYAATFNGLVASFPYAAVGVFTFDGNGSASGGDHSSFNGAQGEETFTGEYEVNADCTGTLTALFQPGDLTGTVGFAIVDNGKEVWLVETDPMTILSGVLRRQ